MNYRQVGRYGLRVSALSLGSWIMADDLARMEESAAIFRRAYELGINTYDTADAYSEGRAETILGRALAPYSRQSYVLCTKVYWPTDPGPNERGLSRVHILRAIEASLKRLRTDYVDLYYCHWWDAAVPLDETLRAMEDIIRQGKALYLGVSNWTAHQMRAGQQVIDKYLLHPIAANQPSYNMLDRYIERETLPYCRATGIGVIAYSPLAQGVLTGKYHAGGPLPDGSRAAVSATRGEVNVGHYLHHECLRVVDALRPLAAELGLSMAQLALAWALRRPEVASLIIGASNTRQLEENAAAAEVVLPVEALARITTLLDGMQHTVKHNVIGG